MTPDVVVVGAGCAGLAAATALSAAGARVLVLEARPILGGRASAVRDAATGEKLDNGQHVLMGCYDETLAFLERLGAGDRVRRQDGLALTMIDRDGGRSTLRLPPLPAPLHLLAGLAAWEALSWPEVASMLRVGAALRAGTRSDGTVRTTTVREWLDAHGQAPRLIELFWEPLAVAALNQPIDEAAVDTFLEVLRRVFGASAERASLVIPAVPLDEMYAVPALDYIQANGGEVRTHARAQMRFSGNRVAGVTVRDEHIDAPWVVAAVPWYALPSSCHGAPDPLRPLLADAAATAASPIVTVNLWYDRPVMDEMLVGLPGRTFQWVFDKARVFGRSRSHLSLVCSGAAGVVAESNETLIARACYEVEEALPRAADAHLVHASAVRERQATFSLAPGQPPRPGTMTAVEGLLLASDWVDTGLPATIESAVVAGHRAAAAVLAGHAGH